MIFCALMAIALAAPVAPAQEALQPQPSQGSQEKPAAPVAGIQAGKILHAVPPRYPAAAKAAGIGGTVVLRGTIEKDGTLDHLEVLSGPAELQQAAIDAASQWIYQPYLLNGQPTSVDTRLNINFNLGPKAAPADPNAPKPLRVSSGVMAGQITHKVMPAGKPDWTLEHASGTAMYRAVIGKDGKVKDLSPVSGSAMVQAYFYDSVRQWTYHPYELNGEPVEVETTIVINSDWGAPPTDAGHASATDAPAPIRVSGGVMQGRLLNKVMPIFSRAAYEQHVVGNPIVCHVIIGKDGRIKEIQVVSGPEVVRKAYVDAFRQWIYQPYLLNGEPVEVDTTITMSMQFGGGPPPADAP